MGWLKALAPLAAGLLVGAACAPDTAGEGAREARLLWDLDLPETIEVTSPVAEDGGALPQRFTCDGTGISPALIWSGVPDLHEELAIVVDDPDADQGPYLHWVVIGIGPQYTAVAEDHVPEGAVETRNPDGPGYAPPCPPRGDGPHTYRFSVYALGSPVPSFRQPVSPGRGLQAIRERAVARGTLDLTYER